MQVVVYIGQCHDWVKMFLHLDALLTEALLLFSCCRTWARRRSCNIQILTRTNQIRQQDAEEKSQYFRRQYYHPVRRMLWQYYIGSAKSNCPMFVIKNTLLFWDKMLITACPPGCSMFVGSSEIYFINSRSLFIKSDVNARCLWQGMRACGATKHVKQQWYVGFHFG